MGQQHSSFSKLGPALLFAASLTVFSQPAITTYRNDLARTGGNSAETILTPQNVRSATFGMLFSLPIDGPTNAQPLYMPQVNIPGKGIHNVLYVVTEHDSVYAFDADANVGANATPLWKATLLDAAHGAAPGAIPEPVSDLGNCGDIPPEVGIVGTPVIDPTTNTIYLVGKTNENGLPVQRLHALDLTTGAEKPHSPVVIQASVAGTGSGSTGGQLNFDTKWSIQRPALLLLSGYVYIGFASHCDFSTWHGWMMSYNASTLQQASAIAMTPNTTGSGIWMSGGAPAAEVVNGVSRFFVSTGNGTYDANGDYGDDILRIESTNGVMRIADHFTPSNQATLQSADADVSSGGALLLPDQTAGGHQRLLVLAAKEGRIYVVDRDNMSGYNTPNNIVQDMVGAMAGNWSTPAYWNNTVYFWGCTYQDAPTTEVLRAYSVTGGRLSTSPVATSTRTSLFPGSILSISSNGNSNGIVWGAIVDQYVTAGNAILLAFDATNVGNLLWASDQNSTRDNLGRAVKYTVPTIVNGKVYAGNEYAINVYGLLPTTAVPPSFSPAPGTYSGSVTVTLTNPASNATMYYTLDGSTPTTASAVYGSGINLTTSATVNAIAVVPGLGTSSVGSATYTVNPLTGTNFNVSSFNAGAVILNGNAIPGNVLTLTTGQANQTSSAYYPIKLPIQSFTTNFTFQMQNPVADGMMFVIQNSGPTALGGGGGGLGYSGMDSSVGIKFDIYNNAGEGTSSTGIFTQGKSPLTPAQDLVSLGIDLRSGHLMNAAFTYDGTTLKLVLTDQVTAKTATLNWAIDIPGTVRGTTAYVGFTAATGGLSTTAIITNWAFSSSTVTPQADFSLTAAPNAVSLNPGVSGTSQISVTPSNGFTGAVSFSASGVPAGVAASFSPASSTTGSILTLSAASNAAPTTATIAISGVSGTLSHTTTVTVQVAAVVPNPDFGLSATPNSVSVQAGKSTTSQIAVAPLNGFTGAVAFSVTGLPAGVTASFSPAGSPTGSTLTLNASSTATVGSTTITITGTSGALSHTATIGVQVTAAAANPVSVDLSGSYNHYGILSDGTLFPLGYLDGSTASYSAQQLGTTNTWSGITFRFGPVGSQDSAVNRAIPLPAGKFSALKFLGVGVNGNQTSQRFTILYTDNTSSVVTINLSDWMSPQSYAGESIAAKMAYRDLRFGGRQTASTYLYGYSLSLDPTKTVSRITLPTTNNVVVLSMALVP